MRVCAYSFSKDIVQKKNLQSQKSGKAVSLRKTLKQQDDINQYKEV